MVPRHTAEAGQMTRNEATRRMAERAAELFDALSAVADVVDALSTLVK